MDDKLYTQIIERLAKIEVKIDDIKSLKNKVEEHDKNLVSLIERDEIQQKEIDELRKKDKDNYKLIVGTIVSFIASLVMYFIQNM